MKLYTLYVGVPSTRLQQFYSLITGTFGGFTLLPGIGGWETPDGEILTESTSVIQLLTDKPGHLVTGIARQMAQALGQSEVYVTSESKLLTIVTPLLTNHYSQNGDSK